MRWNPKTWRIAAAALVLAAPPAMAEVKIGAVAPLSGGAAATGISLRDGMRLAATEWNERGGVQIDGAMQLVTVIFEDSQARPEVGVSAAQKLLSSDDVDFLIGEAFASSVSLAIMELSPEFDTPMMSGQSIASAISEKIRAEPEKYGRYFKGNFSSDVYAVALEEFTEGLKAAGELPAEGGTLAFVIEDTDAGRSNVAQVTEKLEQTGWSVATVEVVPMNHTDFFPQLSKLNSMAPDLVVTTFTSPQSGASFVRQWGELDMQMMHAAIYYPLITEFAELAEGVMEGLVWLPKLFDPERVEMHREFAERAGAALDREINTDLAYGYCYMQIALDAINRAGSTDADAIVAALAETDLPCVMGRYKFGPEDNTVLVGAEYLTAPIAQVQDGESLIIWPESLATSEFRPAGNQ